ncbi:MAG: aldo/keto reductase [Bacteriovoracaceae bacterium]
MSAMNTYVTLGNTGLNVSPLSLGTMTFGTEWGWGTGKETAQTLFHRYVEAGGNFIDTADGYTGGTSEEMVGDFVKEKKLRDQLVIATKYTFNNIAGNPNAGGNGRKNLFRSVEGSLKRLKTDYIDLYWVHAWDTRTPVEEVMHSLNSLVEQGKIRYIGLSDCPAWYVSRAQTLSTLSGWDKVAAIQMEYNLVERSIEREYVPMCKELGIGMNIWSPLASGLLSGKHTKNSLQGRLKSLEGSPNPAMARITANAKNWEVVEVLNIVAKEIDRPAAQVALNWVATQPGVTSTIIGATKLDQLNSNLGALDFTIPKELRNKLDQASALEMNTPYMFFDHTMNQMLTGGTKVTTSF